MHKHSAQHMHEFALYVADLSEQLEKGDEPLVLSDKDFYHRITKIIRLKPGELIILFDRLVHIRCTLHEVKKNSLSFQLITQEPNRLFKPAICFGLPVLKKHDTEQAVYHCIATGVTEIQLLKTAKIQRQWSGDAEYERLTRIMIAAAEQSKQFAFPELQKPIPLEAFIEMIEPGSKKIFFDPSGTSFMTLLKTMETVSPTIVLLIGPEGDLNIEEKKQLQRAGFEFCALTPTILRASDAVLLGAGIFRSMFY